MQPLHNDAVIALFKEMLGNKINTIKNCREMTGLGLLEAKKHVELMEQKKGYAEFLMNVALTVAMRRHRTALETNLPGISVLVEHFIEVNPKFSNDRVINHFERIFKLQAAA